MPVGGDHGRKPSKPPVSRTSHGRKPAPPPPNRSRKPPPTPPHRSSGKSACCSYQEAGRAVLRRRWRLAARYVRLDIKARLGVI